jgi:ribosomal protein S18 acetylase RimI-like enzyme
MPAAEDLRIERLDPEEVDVLRPLWLALRDHHATLTEDWGPVRADDDSWARRRRDYVSWLAEPDAFCLVARRAPDGPALGYAVVTVNAGSPTWAAVERFGYLETLSVLPSARGAGVGGALLDGVQAHLSALGVVRVELTMVARNEAARRFYERAGFDVRFVTMVRDAAGPTGPASAGADGAPGAHAGDG